MITREQREFAFQPVTPDTIIYKPNMGNERDPEQDTLSNYLLFDEYLTNLAASAREFGILNDQHEDADLDAEWDKMMSKLTLAVIARAFDDPHLTIVIDDKPVTLPFKNWNRFLHNLTNEQNQH